MDPQNQPQPQDDLMSRLKAAAASTQPSGPATAAPQSQVARPAAAQPQPSAQQPTTVPSQGDDLMSRLKAAQSSDASGSNGAGENPDAGFVPTAAKDVYEFGKGLVTLPSRAMAYAVAGQPHADAEAYLEQQQEQHKQEIYKQFKDQFHQGNYRDAVGTLWQLFDPHYSDANDPLDQMMTAQWDSSAAAKKAMVEAGKKGDSLGVIQHAAGMLPIVSQVDAAMSAYSDNPTRENLAHVVTSALPAFIPSMMRGASKAVGLLKEVKPAIYESHVVNPESGEVVPVEKLSREAPTRQAAGQEVQQAASELKNQIGEAKGAAQKLADESMTAPVKLSDTAQSSLKQISDDVAKGTSLKSLPEGEMGNVKAVIDEIRSKPTLTNDDFQSYIKQLRDKIDGIDEKGPDAAARRQYIKIKQALGQEYYDQLAGVNPAAEQSLREFNQRYADIANKLNDGPARGAFGTDSPETIVRKVTSGSIGESQLQDIKDVLQEADTNKGQTTYWDNFRQSVLKDLYDKNAIHTTADQVPTRVNAEAVARGFDKNLNAYRVLFDDNEVTAIKRQMIQDVIKQRRLALVKKAAGYGSVGGALGGVAGYVGYESAKKLFETLFGG